MHAIARDNLKELVQRPDELCVSIYLPTHRVKEEAAQDSIRFSNLVRQAQTKLKEAGLRTPEVKRLLEPAQALLPETPFWHHQEDGLAVFIAQDFFHYYRLPLSFREIVTVSKHFHVKPLFPLFTGGDTFYILALSKKKVRLFEGTRFGAYELELTDIPPSGEEVLSKGRGQRQLQYHTGAPARGGRRAAMFHGHGAASNLENRRLLRYFQAVDQGVRKLLPKEPIPLILAGPDHLLSLYREANTYPGLVQETITGNHELTPLDELHSKAWKLLEPLFKKEKQKAMDRYSAWAGTGRTSSDMEEILRLAHQGRVETLFVEKHQEPHLLERPREEPMNEAAIYTYLHRGRVFAVDAGKVPGGGLAAALLRY